MEYTFNERVSNYRKNIKGAIAETLVKELFITNKYVVYNYGVEHLVPHFSSRVKSFNLNNKNQDCLNTKVIRQLPDLLVYKDGKTDYVEVKYRSCPDFEDVIPDSDYPFKNAYFIIVKEDGLYIEKASKLINDKEQYKRLLEFSDFKNKLSRDSIKAAEEAVKQYFI